MGFFARDRSEILRKHPPLLCRKSKLERRQRRDGNGYARAHGVSSRRNPAARKIDRPAAMNRRKFIRESFLAATGSLLAAGFAPAQIGVRPKRILIIGAGLAGL